MTQLFNMSQITTMPDQSIAPIHVRRPAWRRRVRALLTTDDSLSPGILRGALGGVILGHGLQKVFGWFGGYGIDGTLGFFASLGMPPLVGGLVIVSDFLGSIALIVGLATRFSAAAAGAVMLGAVALVHYSNGFFMNWAGTPRGEGYEFHLLAIAMAAALVITGGGRGSLDRFITSRGWL